MMTRVAIGRTLVYWQGSGFYFATETDLGLRWHKQLGQCAGAVWAEEAHDLIEAAVVA